MLLVNTMEVPFFGLKRESSALREDLLRGFSRVRSWASFTI